MWCDREIGRQTRLCQVTTPPPFLLRLIYIYVPLSLASISFSHYTLLKASPILSHISFRFTSSFVSSLHRNLHLIYEQVRTDFFSRKTQHPTTTISNWHFGRRIAEEPTKRSQCTETYKGTFALRMYVPRPANNCGHIISFLCRIYW